MSAIQAAVPYFSTTSDKPESRAVGTTVPVLALVAGLLLLGSYAQEAGVVPVTELMPFNDTQSDLTLAEIVGRFESHWGSLRKDEAYRAGKLVLDLSERHQISPSLILAVIESESSFRPAVVSKAGAVGLMQLQPETAQMIASLFHVRSYRSETDLTDPATNLRLGVAYLAYLRRQFGQSLHYLAAYNLGPTALRHRLQSGNYELGSLDPYVRTIHARARSLRGARGGKLHGLAREEALFEI